MKASINFYHCNSSFFLTQTQCNKILQVHIYHQFILKAEGTHHSKKMNYRPGGTWIQNKQFLSLKKPGLILEERMRRMIFSTKEPVYCLGEEGNQCRVKKRGEFKMKGKFEIVITQISVFTLISHTLYSMHNLVISSIYYHPSNKLCKLCSAPTIHDSMG